MPRLIGPDFIGLQADDLDAAEAFYGGTLGLPVARRTPEGVVFATTPASFAVRKPLGPLAEAKGSGVSLWFACDDPQGLHDRLAADGIAILAAPAPGPFGLAFTFRDPFGYAVVAHEAPRA